tara:strand:- start:66 stop:917 length:852 start_codon:yes stop_codon:yes gene_type:complete
MDKHPREAMSLQSLWRTQDAADGVVKFLDLRHIAKVEVLSRSFAANHMRLLIALAPTSVIKKLIMRGARDRGRDLSLFRERWDDGLAGWTTYARPGPLVEFTATVEREPENHLLMASNSYNASGCGLIKSVWGERNHVKLLKFRCRYEAGHPCGGGDFELRSNHHQICRIYFRPVGHSTTQKELVWEPGLIGSAEVICEDAQPGRWYHIEADFRGVTTNAMIKVDGDKATLAEFRPYPFKSVVISNYHAFTSRFAGIEVWYDREPISPNFLPDDRPDSDSDED